MGVLVFSKSTSCIFERDILGYGTKGKFRLVCGPTEGETIKRKVSPRSDCLSWNPGMLRGTHS